MNTVVLLGRLSRDPEMRYAQGDQGTAIASFSLAVDRRYKKEGQPTADFINCKAFGKAAEIIGKYCTKGKQIAVTGEIQTGSYTNKEGKKVYTTDVLVTTVQLLGSSEPAKTTQNAQAPAPAPQPDPEPTWEQVDDITDDDIPF